MKFSVVVLFLFAFSTMGYSQNRLNPKNHKGDFYFYWGWNEAKYSKSDINFKGKDYDFQLRDVKAKDRQSDFKINKYLNPTNMTIPQFNFRIGYFLKENYTISVGLDHMKYIVVPNQVATISGSIEETGNVYNGYYDNEEIEITGDFLQFEHTDGLNYINADFRRVDEIYALSKDIRINISEGLGAGIIIPKTNSTLLNKDRYDEFHLSGYGVNALVALNITFFDVFFVQSELKGGYINMPDIRTTQFTEDKASQSFFFSQLNLSFGVLLDFNNKKKTP